ncbi:MAG: DUF1570 domain-containing protein [Planctomycetota bacterium]
MSLLLTLAIASSAPAAEFMFRATIDGQTLEGRPLVWSKTEMHLLGRDGRLHAFDPRRATDAAKTSPAFRGYTDAEMRKALYREFNATGSGDAFDFTSTGHYLVVHPKGEGGQWAGRFEQVYRALGNYLRVRGFSAAKPAYPLVAIVLHDESQYRRFTAKSGTRLLPGALGHYSHASNRVVLYDQTRSRGGSAGDWQDNADTIIHEATHQVAFNIGVHSRTADCPYWAPEGLAMLFESRGVWDPKSFDRARDRVNQGRLDDFRYFTKEGRPPFPLAEFVASDTPFKRNGAAAYAQAWALTFYLAETRPREYSRYLKRTAARRPFSSYPAAARVADFRDAFGGDLDVLTANWVRWMDAI